ncbi:CRISPR-associated endonuclease Cas2 [Catellicoccus marimammalium]|nr:CRISPR-associated endonuclease Cas2 [Catellicoccus marimammalium]
MRILCMFDLPMETKREQKYYREFRKCLLENGFTMMQYSVYQRPVPNRQSMKKYQAILQRKIPQQGEVRLLYVTERQYNDMQFLLGTSSRQEELVGNKKLVVI